MPRNDDRLVRYGRQVPLGCTDHPVDTASGRVVDEGVEAVPPRVANVNQISLFECYGDVAVCMRRAVVLQRQGRVVVVEACTSRKVVVGRASGGAGGNV